VPVAPSNSGSSLTSAHLIGITKLELACFEWPLIGVGSGKFRFLDRGMADASLIEWLSLAGTRDSLSQIGSIPFMVGDSRSSTIKTASSRCVSGETPSSTT